MTSRIENYALIGDCHVLRNESIGLAVPPVVLGFDQHASHADTTRRAGHRAPAGLTEGHA
jgi:hypothetical protein